MCAVLSSHRQRTLLRRDFQLQSAGLQARLQHKLWRQERQLLLQESQHLKQSLLLTSVKLRGLLKHWRLGHKLASDCRDGRDFLEVNSLKELYLLLEEEKHLSGTAHSPLSPCSAACRSARLENKTGKTTTSLSSPSCAAEALDPPDLKVALKREREAHQLLLAESYAAVMDLTKQLQIGERNWSREKMELVETLGQERALWEQRGGELKLQAKSKARSSREEDGSAADGTPSDSSPLRSRSMSELHKPEINGLADQEERSLFTAPPTFLIGSELGDITGKNWSYLTNETPEVADSCKTWDGPTGPDFKPDPESVQKKSFTAPDRTGIRIYYSPPTARRMECLARHQAAGSGSLPPQAHNGALGLLGTLNPVQQQPPSSYEQWLSSLSAPHLRRHLLAEGADTNGAVDDGAAMDSPASPSPSSSPSSTSSSASSASSSSSPSFRGLSMGDISVNLSDDMKEMTNCVRQAISSSSLERKSPKEPGSQVTHSHIFLHYHKW
ncbi:hypothetical protein CRUP_038595 [Coryphaenoides rupestris]|nr:hypothetical protein CRUP_038595 [Coryphaenoides rupestris]